MQFKARKRTAWLSTLLCLAFIAAGCGNDSSNRSSPTTTSDNPATPQATSTPTTAAPEPDQDRDPTAVVIGLEQEITNFNNLTSGDNLLAGRQITRAIYPTCTRTRPDFTFEPYFCEQLPTVINEDPLVVEYKLRADATWSDGTPVSSDDLVFYYENCNDAEDDCAATAGFDSAELEVVDSKTVRLSWAEGKPFVEYITLFSGPFPPAHLGRDWSDGFREDPGVVAGAFRVDEYNPGSDLTLVPNPTWFGEGPHIDEVTFRFISDVSNLPFALQNGEVDVIYPQPQVDLVDQIAALDGVSSTVTFGPAWEHITFNTTTVPLAVRRAIALALDRSFIVAALMHPFSPNAQPLGNRIFVNGQPKYLDNTPTEFSTRDVDAAKATLEEAGWAAGSDGIYNRDGNRLSLRIRTTGGNPRREQFQQLVQNQLGEAGIEVTIDNLPGGEIFAPVFGNDNDPPGPPGDFDLVIFAWVGGPLPASSSLQVFGTGSDSNPGAYVDDQVNDLLNRASVTLDFDRQADLLNQADVLMWDTLPNVPVYQLPFFLAYNNALSNLQDNPTLESFTWNLEDWRVS
ncbi:MAG: ABC transporter family substrate-binding protein [Acidimicrobiia bacterium]|nr:ABC transporter family substrate-binding protein [Acidimicrobiia bacterium]